MQKKLIALAVAGLVSAPVMAQSNVQIYGIVDMGYQYLGSSEASGDATKLRSRSGIDSGLQSASRIGFRGTEDLGNGLSAFFNIEQGINADRDSTPSGNRQAFVGLRGNFGQVSLGRQWAPARQFVSAIDPFSNDHIGKMDNFYVTQQRLDNSIIYTTPDFAGFKVGLAYSQNAIGDEAHTLRGDSRDNNRYWGITPTYSNGPLLVGASYYQIKNDADSAANPFFDDVEKRRSWDVGAAYDFGVIKAHAMYGQEKFDRDTESDEKIKQWMVGLSAPVSEAGNVMASYTRSKFDSEGGRAGRWALGYTHALSKRTNLYAAVAKVNTNSSGEGFYGVDGLGGRDQTSGSGVDEIFLGSATYTSGAQVGIRHRF